MNTRLFSTHNNFNAFESLKDLLPPRREWNAFFFVAVREVPSVLNLNNFSEFFFPRNININEVIDIQVEFSRSAALDYEFNLKD